MKDWFSWNNVKSTNYGIHITAQPSVIRASERATFTNVPARSGSLTTLEADDVYDDFILPVECVVRDLSQIHEIGAWLKGAGTLRLAARPGGFFYARIANQIEFAKVLRNHEHRTFTINFRSEGFRRPVISRAIIYEHMFRVKLAADCQCDFTGRSCGSLPLGRWALGCCVFVNEHVCAFQYVIFGCKYARFVVCFKKAEYRVGAMIFDYKPLWKMLIDRNMTKSELRVLAGISTRALAKLGKNEDVSTDVLRKICAVLECDLTDIMETYCFSQISLALRRISFLIASESFCM